MLNNFMYMPHCRHIASARSAGFTFIEVIISVFIFGVIAAMIMGINSNFLSNITLDTKSDELVGMLRLSQTRALSGYGNADWGVHFQNPVGTTNSFTLFKGSTYVSREMASTIENQLPPGYSFSTISLSGAATDVIFLRGSGRTLQDGFIEITGPGTSVKRIAISSRGVIKKS